MEKVAYRLFGEAGAPSSPRHRIFRRHRAAVELKPIGMADELGMKNLSCSRVVKDLRQQCSRFPAHDDPAEIENYFHGARSNLVFLPNEPNC